MKMDIVYSLQAQQESSYPTALKNIDTWPSDRVANYTGSDRKEGVIGSNGRRYLIKYAQKHTGKDDMDTSDVNNALSEYLSSHILGIIGYPVHHTFLATRNRELVIACENFIQKDQELIEFGTYMRKQYDSAEISRVPRYRQIKEILSTDPDLRMNPNLWNDYCRRFVGDAFVGNFDRHMGNWGYLVSGTDRTAPPVPAPVYDNGSTLFPALSSKEMHTILSEKKGPGFQRVYLDDVLSEDERMLRIEAIADPHTQTPEQIYIQKEQLIELYAALDKLTAREQTYLLYRYGFTDGIEHPLIGAALHFHLSESWTKKVEGEAMDSLRGKLPWWF